MKLYDCLYNWAMFTCKRIDSNHVNINGRLRIIGHPKEFSIGDGVQIVSEFKSNPLGGGYRTFFALSNDAVVRIGDRTGISNSAFRLYVGINIGNDVNIGGDCKFYDSDMHSIEFACRVRQPDTNIHQKEIVIKNGVWIGAHSLILKGVTIGERSVIGAGSVVAKDVPSDEIWAGNPAVFIRKINQEV